MWMRRGAALLPPLFCSSKCYLFNQVQGAGGLRICRMLSTDIQKPDGRISLRETTPFIAFVLGGPGSGKGTQCMRIVENFGFTHLSAGDLLRHEISSNSEYGPMILSTIKDGKIVPSEVTVKLLQKAIESTDNDKFLIDGFPRSEENRLQYERIIGMEPSVVLFFDCPEEEMVKRVLNRRQGRIDDNEETVKERLKVFMALTMPVVDYYARKGKLCKIDATGTEDEIFAHVLPAFEALQLNATRQLILPANW